MATEAPAGVRNPIHRIGALLLGDFRTMNNCAAAALPAAGSALFYLIKEN